MAVYRKEAATVVAIVALIFFYLFGGTLTPEIVGPATSMLLLVILFCVMLWAAFSVVRHAECLAVILGEPYGTLILTLSVIGIEVALIAAIMIAGADKPALARDTMFSIIMIVLNGLVGLSLVFGGLKHRLQEYNLQGANAYLAVLMPFALLGLVLPSYTQSAPGGQLSVLMAAFLIVMSVLLYGIFLAVQTITHSDIFKHRVSTAAGAEADDDDHHGDHVRSIPFHSAGLIAALLPIVLLSKQLAVYVDFGIGVLGAPLAFGGFLIAALILTPEALSAIRSARRKQLQRSVNICLGSSLSTMGLTIPTVLVIGWIINEPVELGLEPTEIVMLAATLAVSLVTFISRRAHALLGAVHLSLFAAYVALLFDGSA
ncbi:calcium:proton antiporter [Hoeflea poritis]|uniref:Calcium:proton antiporter n=1 Tax=Hoeflea poritis TaxID=2993659 RepID=A0ABT4VJB0_9HYPH|nr:calcium:proton antiporter [Hoeflea poritis]MDA4844803.1 calcium:proton antiporter [Hoeflea poritis]